MGDMTRFVQSVRADAARAARAARRDVGRSGRELRALLRARDQRRSVSVRRGRRTRASARACRSPSGPSTCCTATCRAAAGQLYGYRVHGPWDPDARSAVQPGQGRCSIRTRARSAARRRGIPSLLRVRARHRTATARRITTDSAPYAPLGAVVDHERSTGAAIQPPRTSVARDGDLRAARQGLHGAASARAAGTARHVPRPRGAAGRSSTCSALGVTAVELMPVHAHADERRSSSAGSTNYWGYNTLGVLRARRRASPRRRDPLARRASSRRWCARCTTPASKSSSTSSTTTPPRAITSGPTLSFRGIDNTTYYRLEPGQPVALRGLHRLRQHAQHAVAARAAADDGQPALLGRGDARRRLPLRPGVGARARARHAVDRLPSFFDVDRSRIRSSRASSSSPSRGTSATGGYQVGNFPPGWSGVERPVSRRRAPLLARRRGRAARAGDAPGRQQRSLRPRRAGSRTRASTSSRRTTASRSPISWPTTRSTTRPTARRTATATRTTSAGTAASKVRPTTRRCATLRERQRRNFLADAARLAGRADAVAAATSWAASQHGNNNAYCQDSPLTWTPWEPTTTRRAVPRVRPRRLPRSARASRCCGAGRFSTGRRPASPTCCGCGRTAAR